VLQKSLPYCPEDEQGHYHYSMAGFFLSVTSLFAYVDSQDDLQANSNKKDDHGETILEVVFI